MRRARLGPIRDDVNGARCSPYAQVIRRDCPKGKRTDPCASIDIGLLLFKIGRDMDTANKVSQNQETQFQYFFPI